MEYKSIYIEETGTRIELTSFTAGDVTELHAMLHVDPRGDLFEAQLCRIAKAEGYLMATEEAKDAQPVFKRYFLSDAANQAALITKSSQ